jgi:4-diphosphocytidyl-2-C-methyl-D-erythritol kinase
MRGRGEQVEALPATAAARVSGRRVVVFKPSFGISTPWAYGRMVRAANAGRQDVYIPAEDAERTLRAWVEGAAPVEELVANNMEGVAFEKFIALPQLLEKLRRDFGVATCMSGSGSACFALLREDQATALVAAAIRSAWGEGAFIQEARLT